MDLQIGAIGLTGALFCGRLKKLRLRYFSS